MVYRKMTPQKKNKKKNESETQREGEKKKIKTRKIMFIYYKLNTKFHKMKHIKCTEPYWFLIFLLFYGDDAR